MRLGGNTWNWQSIAAFSHINFTVSAMVPEKPPFLSVCSKGGKLKDAIVSGVLSVPVDRVGVIMHKMKILYLIKPATTILLQCSRALSIVNLSVLNSR